MKALIDPNTSVSYVSSWTSEKPYKAIYTEYPNSARVCQVEEIDFPVAQPLFWVNCFNDVVADQFYYNTTNETINLIVDEPYPAN